VLACDASRASFFLLTIDRASFRRRFVGERIRRPIVIIERC